MLDKLHVSVYYRNGDRNIMEMEIIEGDITGVSRRGAESMRLIITCGWAAGWPVPIKKAGGKEIEEGE